MANTGNKETLTTEDILTMARHMEQLKAEEEERYRHELWMHANPLPSMSGSATTVSTPAKAVPPHQGHWVQPGNIMPPPVPKNNRPENMLEVTSEQVERLRKDTGLSQSEAELLGWLVDLTGDADHAERLFHEMHGPDQTTAHAVKTLVRNHQQRRIEQAMHAKRNQYAMGYGAAGLPVTPGKAWPVRGNPQQAFQSLHGKSLFGSYAQAAAEQMRMEMDRELMEKARQYEEEQYNALKREEYRAKMRDPKQQVQAQREELDKGKRKWYNPFS